MHVALVLDPVVDAGLAQAQTSFHSAAGVAEIVVADDGSPVGAALAGDAALRVVAIPPGSSTAERHAALVSAAVADGAEWVLEAAPGVFWWPRGGDLADTLAAVPRRYDVVRSLDRQLLFERDAGSTLISRATLRRAGGLEPADPATARAARRSTTAGTLAIRGWRPFETLIVPSEDDPSNSLAPDDVAEGLGSGALLRDTRLRDALDLLAGKRSAGDAQVRLDTGRLRFRRPSLADGAAYALEMAVVEPYDVERMHERLAAFDDRIGALEGQPWSRAVRRVFGQLRRAARA